MNIVLLTEEHIDTARQIVRQLTDPESQKDQPPSDAHLDRLLSDPSAYLLAAFVDDTVVGYTLAYRFPSLYADEQMAYLYDIGVQEAHRRKGIGRQLVETLKIHLRNDGVREMWLGTGVDNEEGQALFRATGGLCSGEAFNDYTFYL